MAEPTLREMWMSGRCSVADLRDAGLLDGLPIIEPTASSIDVFLDAADIPMAMMPIAPSFETASSWDVAFCCLMADCPVTAAPLVAACLAAVADPSFNLLAVQTTTSSVAPMFVVTGPIVASLGLDSGADAMAGTSPLNAAVGRAVRLLLRAVGGARVGVTDMATLGQPGKLTWCLAESSDHAWSMADDWSVSRVTAIAAGGMIEVVLSAESVDSNVDVLVHACNSLRMAGSGDRWGRGQILVVLPPESVARFAAAGLTRERVSEVLHTRGIVDRSQLSVPVAAEIATARSARGDDPNAPVRVSRSPSDAIVAVSGGTGIKAQIVPSWSTLSTAVTTALTSPDRPDAASDPDPELGGLEINSLD